MQEAYEADFHLYLILSDVNSIESRDLASQEDVRLLWDYMFSPRENYSRFSLWDCLTQALLCPSYPKVEPAIFGSKRLGCYKESFKIFRILT